MPSIISNLHVGRSRSSRNFASLLTNPSRRLSRSSADTPHKDSSPGVSLPLRFPFAFALPFPFAAPPSKGAAAGAAGATAGAAGAGAAGAPADGGAAPASGPGPGATGGEGSSYDPELS